MGRLQHADVPPGEDLQHRQEWQALLHCESPHHVICHYIIELCILNQFQVSGPSRGICKFPFEHNGKIYEECTTEGLPSDVRKGPWCPTDVDETGTVNLGKRRHGHCRCLGSPRQIQ